MEVTYSINNREVEKAVFKTFSSQCEKWLTIIAEKQTEIEAYQGKINLIYYPAWNIVVPVCKPTLLLNALLGTHYTAPQTGVEKIMNAIKAKMQVFKVPHNVSSLEKI